MSLYAPVNLPGGQQLWESTEVHEFVARLKELHPDLCLYRRQDGAWEIWECSPYHPPAYIMRSKPGAKLSPEVIERLRAHDVRYNDVTERVIQNNDRVKREADERAADAIYNALDRMLSKSWRGRVPTNVEDVDIT